MMPIDRSPPTGPAPVATDDGDGFLARWSRRKREAARAEPSPAHADPAPEGAAPVAMPEAEPDALSEEDLAALPRVEDLTETSDLAPFLRRGVPASLKNAALRKIWMMTPAIRDHQDPAVDYAWDWNTPGGVPGDGCAPSAEATARMLKDLVEPRVAAVAAPVETAAPAAPMTDIPGSPAPDDLDAGTRAPGPISAEAIDPTTGPDKEPTDAARPVDASPARLEPLRDPDQAPSLSDLPVVRKRHGGAFPS